MNRLLAAIGLIVLSPLLLLIILVIRLSDKGSIFFIQNRIGFKGKPFRLLKFRTMRERKEQDSQLTVGDDNRITGIGKILRKTKADELPQLINVLKGEMWFVGPRPEVEKYVKLYDLNQQKVLQLKPGITDVASLKYYNESELLGLQAEPEKYYIEKIMPDKIRLNLRYAGTKSWLTDLTVITVTVLKPLGFRKPALRLVQRYDDDKRTVDFATV